MKLTKQDTRLRRALRGRVKIKELAALRLSVHRTPQHIYAQIFAAAGRQGAGCRVDPAEGRAR